MLHSVGLIRPFGIILAVVPSAVAASLFSRTVTPYQRRDPASLHFTTSSGQAGSEHSGWIGEGVRLALAGALAGGTTNFVLHPIDVGKTIRQSQPTKSTTIPGVLLSQVRSYGPMSLWSGLTPAVLGAMPSSALYFGTYEYVKRKLKKAITPPLDEPQKTGVGVRASLGRRTLVHGFAAVSGNTASSAIFVPKEVIKQQMQTMKNRGVEGSSINGNLLWHILRRRGLRGIYSGYRATLLRNIPSAILRFTLYEEFRLAIAGNDSISTWLRSHNAHFVAGALAGAISSALTTPLDVVKTRMALDACPVGSNALTCLASVGQKEGVRGLFAGLGYRVVYSSLFGAVGFASFEYSKKILLGAGEDGCHGTRPLAARHTPHVTER